MEMAKQKKGLVTGPRSALVQKEMAVGAFWHPPRKIEHRRLGSDREVSEHGVGAPSR